MQSIRIFSVCIGLLHQLAHKVGVLAGVFQRQVRHQQRLRIENLRNLLCLFLVLCNSNLQQTEQSVVRVEFQNSARLHAHLGVQALEVFLHFERHTLFGHHAHRVRTEVVAQTDLFDRIAERIYQYDEVESIALMAGAYDLSVTVRGTNVKDVSMFVSQRLATLAGVLSTATYFVLKKYKEKGIIIEGEEKDERGYYFP